MKKPNSRTATQKYFIDYENEIRECGKCGIRKPFSAFRIVDTGYPSTACKECTNRQARARYLARKAEKELARA